MARVYAELRSHTTTSADSTLVVRRNCLVHVLHPSPGTANLTAPVVHAQLSAWWRQKFRFPLELDGENLSRTVNLTDTVFHDLVSLRLSAAVTQLYLSLNVLAGLEELDVHSSILRDLHRHRNDFKALQALMVHNFSGEDFDFASQIASVTDVRLSGGDIASLDMRQFAAAATLERLAVESHALTNLVGLERCAAFEALAFVGCHALFDLSAVAHLPQLRSFNASGSDATCFTWLSECHQLEELKLASTAFTNLFYLRDLTLLKVLDISDGDVRSISELSNCVALEKLDISYCLDITDIASLSQLPFLSEVKAHHCGVRDVGGRGGWRALEMMCVADCKELHSLGGLEGAPQLKIIDARCSTVEDISGLSRCPLLEAVNFVRCVRLRSLAPLAGAPRLRIVAAGGSGVSDVSGLGRCPELRAVNFLHCTSLHDISPLAGAPQLTRMIACESTVRNINGLNSCAMLAVVDFDCCKNLESLSPLAGAPRLHTIIASHSGVQTIAGLHTCSALRTVELLLCHELQEGVKTEFKGHERSPLTLL
ncbi:hypothetical protein ABB37_07251 [Leptomonas pyrrhocoris]|uniref:Leucine-rich repeat protein (LRRP) n=1 Tax=Leptomonas pyrrhocoris TaxID=157538 RepID=A0A0N0DTE3_LEPPY|nr:hypothetical protein ABB37_07251 [Leptomonas pyrrhocoris]KPA77388.1 hypothetical protein ABB37_07251 [Leptomonas pyrrhocoris]|eukprot:XP_015655827.1 hypothetical protein ABB37_07251 [Leptomonas pyrrhocoris]